MSVTKAEKAVRELESEQARLEKRIVELEGQQESATVGKLGPLTTELAANRDTLALVGDRLLQARQAVKGELATVNAARIAELYKEEARLWEEASTIFFGPFRDKMDALRDVHRDLGRLGALGRSVGSPIAYQALDQMRRVRCQEIGDFSDYPH